MSGFNLYWKILLAPISPPTDRQSFLPSQSLWPFVKGLVTHSIPLGTFPVVSVLHSTCCVEACESLLQPKISLSTYCATEHNDYKTHNRRKKEEQLPLKGFPFFIYQFSSPPEPCYLGLAFHPSLNFKVKPFHKWSALALENPNSPRGER